MSKNNNLWGVVKWLLGIQETRNKDLMIPPKQEKSIAVIQNTPCKSILILPKQVKSLTIVTPPYTGKVGRIRVRRTLDNMPKGAEEFYAALSEMDVALRNAVIQELRTASTRAEYTVGTPLIIYAEDKSDVSTKAHDAIKHIHDRGGYDEVHNIVITSYVRIHSNIVIEELNMCNITPPTTTPKGFNRQWWLDNFESEIRKGFNEQVNIYKPHELYNIQLTINWLSRKFS